MKKISILGSTGSIGTQSLEVIRSHNQQFNITSMTAGNNISLFREQLKEFNPAFASVALEKDARILSQEFPAIDFSFGIKGLCVAATDSQSDMIINGLVGMLGLIPTVEAIKAGKDIAFANKETLVAGGAFIMSAVKAKRIKFLPVDSEHSAIFQCLQGNPIKRIILTASGGPFRGYTKEMLNNVTLAQTLKHPRWNMGAKISVDSATMMNKGLEIIEAKWLFDMNPNNIEVVVHPESILHSAVEFKDSSIIGQMGLPDMKVPIAYALSYPQRMENVGDSLDLFALGAMHFEKPDYETFRCVKLAYQALSASGSCPIVLNASNEEAVDAFLNGKIKFMQIADLVEKALNVHNAINPSSVEEIIAVEAETRAFVCNIVRGNK